MTLITRRQFLQTAGATALVASNAAAPWVRRARAAEFSYKFGSDLPASHPMNVRMQQAADAIRKETSGRVDIRLFPNNQLGGDPDMFSQLRAGALEFFTLSGANVLSTLVPKTSISGVGFAFKDSTQVFQAMDGELGAHLRELIAQTGTIVALEKMWDNGFRQITSSTHPIATVDDLKGFKIRVPVGRMWTSLFESLGASPTGISFNEVYSALQTHVVDGQENALAVASVSKLYEVQKYCSMTNHMWDGFWFLCNAKAWQRMPASVRDIVARHINAAALDERKDVAALNNSLKSQLERKGLAFNTPDPAPFRDKLRKAGFYANWQRTFGEQEWALLEKVTGKLA